MKRFFLIFVPVILLAATIYVPVEWDPYSVRDFTGTLTYIKMNIAIFESEGIRYELHTGPNRYLRRHGIILKEGSRIKVRGMILKVKGQYYIFAQRIKYGSKVLNVRDKDGNPLWLLNVKKKLRRTR